MIHEAQMRGGKVGRDGWEEKGPSEGRRGERMAASPGAHDPPRRAFRELSTREGLDTLARHG